ncbi:MULTISPECIES: RNA-directed DNA polymerase [unclassified Mesorhizobium]|uniref:RNA-directed DNA polymerase n=1 Tax=unclassified Mesorhizobium TaxID=325217 RepID=UPI000F7539D2|nr:MULTISPECIES: RNA-directed DNA polymerase [unclassified Mesorhizobium]AZO57058.1 RNA-directed DNA polymerase [Mesorhizobium sp. M8A.F.Ca.ET.057.01.1.1]RWE48098.1 MAG: RNA-directed DNA polymerase [Mesorhizobium sp.]
MADVKLGEPFGMESAAFAKMNLDLSIKRILNDVKSDFIYAPHLSLIYARAGDALKEAVSADIKAGQFTPGIPISMEVPKSFRIPVESTKRLGPAYSRSGSILLPKDRLLYQALADRSTAVIGKSLDNARSFSHQLADEDSPAMFLSTRKCWNDLQSSLSESAKDKNVQYVLKLDIANYFSSINLHTLINVLNDSGFEKSYSSRLEAMLTSFTGERSSRGILQGIFPSDLLGNFYMAPIDRILKDMKLHSARYVDDLYIFVDSVEHADRILRDLIPALRSYDLSLNESKCKIIPKTLLHTMEPDLESLFQAAVDEIADQIDDEDFDADYGFQSEWESEDEEDAGEDEQEEVEETPIELAATMSLFDSMDEYPGQEENVERFCLPLFAKAGSDHAVEHVKDAFKRRPSMAQIYSSYLAKFLENKDLRSFVVGLAADEALADWQRMWLIAAMMQASEPTDDEVKIALDIAKDGNRHDALRAVAAYYVGRFGDHARRTSLRTLYAQVSNYVQAAIYASSRFWPGVERLNAKATWAGHGQLHSLLTIAMKK